MDEKRQFERADFGAEVEVHLQGKQFRAHLRDLSVGGAYVVSTEKLAFGTTIKLVLILPAIMEKGPRTLTGIVRWVKADGFGVQFGPTGALDTFALADYVARKNKQI
ncbi:MAG: hypothetical protein NVS3B20_27680 [Polyangiales bacterium]